MPYSDDDLLQLEEAYETWTARHDALSMAFLARPYTTDRGREFATHGVSRRLSTIRHCLDRTLDHVPANATQPSRSDLLDATAFLQAFTINVFGVIDNFAHLWCSESGLKAANGRPVHDTQIGLTAKCKVVRNSLGPDLQSYLAGMDEWFGYLESYRHALAHRIPLYIPPRQLNPAAQAEFNDFERRKGAAFAAKNWELANALMDAQERVGTFEPYIMHSFGEQIAPVRFHAQLICDFATVVELGERVLAEIESLGRAPDQ